MTTQRRIQQQVDDAIPALCLQVNEAISSTVHNNVIDRCSAIIRYGAAARIVEGWRYWDWWFK